MSMMFLLNLVKLSNARFQLSKLEPLWGVPRKAIALVQSRIFWFCFSALFFENRSAWIIIIS